MQAFGEAFHGRSAAHDLAVSYGREALAWAICTNIANGQDTPLTKTTCGDVPLTPRSRIETTARW